MESFRGSYVFKTQNSVMQMSVCECEVRKKIACENVSEWMFSLHDRRVAMAVRLVLEKDLDVRKIKGTFHSIDAPEEALDDPFQSPTTH